MADGRCYWKGETSMFVLSDVDIRTMPYKTRDSVPEMALMHPGSDGLTRLLHDVRAYQQTIGQTALSAATYLPDDEGGEYIIHVRVERKSKATASDGSRVENTRTYDFPLSRLAEEREASPADPLISLLSHTIWRESSRAVRHVRYWLTRTPAREYGTEGYWLPSRRVNFVDGLNRSVDPVSREQLFDGADVHTDDFTAPDECGICGLQYEFGAEDAHRPVRIRRCGHVYGYECLKTWVGNEVREPDGTLKVPQCPLRCNIFTGTTVRRREQNGTYEALPQFTAHENFEISCADLDAATPVKHAVDETLTINAEAMKSALDMLENGALLEEAESTPFHLQTVRWADTQLAIIAMDDFFENNDGARMSYGRVWDYVWNVIHEELLAKYKNTMSPYFLSQEERAELTVAQWRQNRRAPVRGGVYEFIDRLIHRIVMFQELRKCDCSRALHKHGERLFWNGEEVTEEVSATVSLHQDLLARK